MSFYLPNKNNMMVSYKPCSQCEFRNHLHSSRALISSSIYIYLIFCGNVRMFFPNLAHIVIPLNFVNKAGLPVVKRIVSGLLQWISGCYPSFFIVPRFINVY